MCGERDLEEFSDSSSDEDTESLDSFRSMKTERKARNWAYCILICYTVAAVTFMGLFLFWFSINKKNRLPKNETD